MNFSPDILFHQYFLQWFELYKKDAIAATSLKKYHNNLNSLRELAPNLPLRQVDRATYQSLLNGYAQTHQRNTSRDFHGRLKACLQEAFETGYLRENPARKAVIKTGPPRVDRPKALDIAALKQLVSHLDLTPSNQVDWALFIMAKTGLRFSEALGITPADVDFERGLLTVNKAWDYKSRRQGFAQTKTATSMRKLYLDQPTRQLLAPVALKQSDPHAPIFIPGTPPMACYRHYHQRLTNLCHRLELTPITLHGLRHSHASLLIFHGISLASISHRLGHASPLTTQSVYIHIIKELETRDSEKIELALGTLL